MKEPAIVHVYNFIRKSSQDPSRFLPDDFETVRREITAVKQYGFPGTYALKYDALMEPRYQQMLKEMLGPEDEIGAWWEITRALCLRAGIQVPEQHQGDYDDRVDLSYSLGFTPEERCRLVDAYMEDFHAVFGTYPKTIGSWVLDSVTVRYAQEHYGILGAAICRDQLGTDGFTLWGGYPTGAYYPSRKNIFIPAQSPEMQLPIPVFRLLGPDPIYNFEQDLRPELQGVYTLEPAWVIGRNPEWIRWFFSCVTEEDQLGMSYAQVGQENNFLWENLCTGLGRQLQVLETLADQGKVRVETMEETARWFRSAFRLSPPMTYQASRDWSDRNLAVQWYACPSYRLGLLQETGHLRIRDAFLYREDYPCRYLDHPMTGTKSNFDALPLLFPQIWQWEDRPFIRLLDGTGREYTGNVTFRTQDRITALAELETDSGRITLTMTPEGLTISGAQVLCADLLPVFRSRQGRTLLLEHEGFSYSFSISQGEILCAGADGLRIEAEDGIIRLQLGTHLAEADVFLPAAPRTEPKPRKKYPVPLRSPLFSPGSSVFRKGECREICISAPDEGVIRVTTDGRVPDSNSPIYSGPIPLTESVTLTARLFGPDGSVSEPACAEYRFSYPLELTDCKTALDPRPVFFGNGPRDLLLPQRGSADYLDGHWRGTLEDWDLTFSLGGARFVRNVSMGFLSNHRGGVVYPEQAELWIGPDPDHLRLYETLHLPCCPRPREIETKDILFHLHREIGAFRIIARRYAKMPDWCIYHGVTNVFTMADHVAAE